MIPRQQQLTEVAWLLPQIAGATRILEIGSCHGWMLRQMASVCAPGAAIRSIDLPGEYPGSEVELGRTKSDLVADGFDCRVLHASSRQPAAMLWAAQWGPYDFLFIDGDHSFEGCMADWLNYGPMAKKVGFHDIAGVADCRRVWAEIITSGKYQWDSKIEAANWMGIGVVTHEAAA